MIEPKWNVIAIINAIFTRIVFILHSCVSTWTCADYYGKEFHTWFYYVLAFGIYGLVAECAYAIIVKKVKPYKWFSPCILMYLSIVVPVIWFLELYMFRARVDVKEVFDLALQFGGDSGGDSGLRMPMMPTNTKPRAGIVFIEQFLIFTLIIGRWMLPKGEMSRDEVTRLMMTYIGMSADIIGLFESFTEEKIKFNYMMTIVILCVWSVSLLQFPLIVIGSKNSVDLPSYAEEGVEQIDYSEDLMSCIPFMAGTYFSDRVVITCFAITFMQDLPFFILRLVMTFAYDVRNYMHTFFLGKNILVLMIMVYKLYGTWVDRKAAAKPPKKEYDEIKSD